MRKIHVVMVTLLLGGCFSAFAQEPDKKNEKTEEEKSGQQQNLNREMTLEREYDPILQDAAKVNTLPVVREMTVTKRPIEFSDYAVPILPEKEMNVLPAGTIMTDVEHSNRNGYLHFGGGMLMNFSGDVGYHVLNTDRDKLGLFFSHRSSNGDVKFKDETIAERKAKLNDNIGGLDYKHIFDAATFSLGGKFGYSAFNYYGMPTNIKVFTANTFSNDTSTNQGDRTINVYAGVSSNIPTSLGYHVGIDYTNFNQKYAISKEFDGMTENNIGISLGINSPVKNGQCFGVDANVNILSYSASKLLNWVVDSIYDNRYDVTFNPYYRINRDKWNLLLGANLMVVSQSEETDVFVSPNIKFDAQIANFSVFYANLGGGINSNTMSDVSRVNRYINPAYAPDASKTWADLQIGVRSSAAAGLWFDIFAGYKYTESDLFFNPSSYNWINDGFNNVSMAYQPTSQRFQVGAALKYDYQQIVDFYLKGVYNSYTLKISESWKNEDCKISVLNSDDLEPYGKPTFRIDAGINVRPVKPLTLSLNYSMLTGMYAYVNDANVKMDAINDLRLRASWKFNDTFSLYLQANNLLFQKYEMFYGYPVQPFTAMAGFNINF